MIFVYLGYWKEGENSLRMQLRVFDMPPERAIEDRYENRVALRLGVGVVVRVHCGLFGGVQAKIELGSLLAWMKVYLDSCLFFCISITFSITYF